MNDVAITHQSRIPPGDIGVSQYLSKFVVQSSLNEHLACTYESSFGPLEMKCKVTGHIVVLPLLRDGSHHKHAAPHSG